MEERTRVALLGKRSTSARVRDAHAGSGGTDDNQELTFKDHRFVTHARSLCATANEKR